MHPEILGAATDYADALGISSSILIGSLARAEIYGPEKFEALPEPYPLGKWSRVSTSLWIPDKLWRRIERRAKKLKGTEPHYLESLVVRFLESPEPTLRIYPDPEATKPPLHGAKKAA